MHHVLEESEQHSEETFIFADQKMAARGEQTAQWRGGVHFADDEAGGQELAGWKRANSRAAEEKEQQRAARRRRFST